MFALLFFVAIIPAFLSIIKIIKRKNLNIFDITLIFSALYFWAIPVQDFMFNHVYPYYLEHISTAITLNIYMYGLLGLAKLYSLYKSSPLNITEKLASLHLNTIKDSFQLFAAIYIVFMLWNITNYSILSEDNIEGNNSFFYGSDQGFIIHIISISFKTFFPVIFILLFRNVPSKRFYKLLRKINLAMLIASLLLGEKTFMVFNLTFLLLYLYSIYRNKINTKEIVVVLLVGISMLSVFFPLSQAFRIYKQNSIMNSDSHHFIEVFTGFINDGIDSDIASQVDRYQKGRSLNLYDALDWASYRTDYRGYGRLSCIVLRYIIPQRVGTDANIMGDLMIKKGADIGESTFAWYVLDWGIIFGPIAALLHIFILYYAIYYFGMFFFKFIKSPIYICVIYSFLLRFAISIEHNPALDIKMFYNTYYLVILFTGIILKIYYKRYEKKTA